MDHDDNNDDGGDDYLSAQNEAHIRLMLTRRAAVTDTSERQQQVLEDGALAHAVAESLLLPQKRRLPPASPPASPPSPPPEDRDAALARRLQQNEAHQADEELAQALEQSEQEAVHHRLQAHLQETQESRSLERHQGSWDCLQCTFTNEPYQRRCAACGTEAPPHVLVFSDIPNIRFGLEIEMLIPMGKRDGFSLQSIAKDLTRMGPPSVFFQGYTHETSEEWKMVTDSSIKTSNDEDLCFELVSPILLGSEGLAKLRLVMENVRKLGIATNASCGFHVHVDAEGSHGSPIRTLESLKRIAQCFVALENAFDLLVALSWDAATITHHRRANSNRYCLSNRLAFGEQSNQQRWQQIDEATSRNRLVELVNPSQDRYRKLNLTNIVNRHRPSTCEFRHHGGVEDLQEAEAWVRFLLLFCQNAATNTTYKKCLLPESATPQDELRALFDLVGCVGLEQFFVVERRLFVEQHHHAQNWTCRVCRRSFRNSRSLAQHVAALQHER